MLRIVLALLLVVGCCGSLSAAGYPSQPDTLVITREMLAKGVWFESSSLHLHLRFHVGDDMRWKEQDFDDSAWQVVRNDTAGRLLPSGIGWFRGYVKLAPDISTTIATIYAYSFFAAEEVYGNGQLLYSAGKPSSVPGGESVAEYSDPLPKAFVMLTAATVHVIAVRFSSWERKRANTWLASSYMRFWFDEGVSLSFAHAQFATDYAAEAQSRAVIRGLTNGIMLLMVLLLGYLALFDKHDRIVRYLLGFTIAQIMLNLTHTVPLYCKISQYTIAVLRVANVIGTILNDTSLFFVTILFFSKNITGRHRIFGIVYGILYICLWFIAPALGIWNEVAYKYIDMIGIIFLVEIVRIVIKGIIAEKKSMDTWIFAGGVLAYALICIIQHWGFLYQQNLLDNGLILSVYSAVPIAFTFVLVRRVVQDRARLARYSQDLERDVADRTRDLQTANEEISRQMEVQAEQAREIEKAHHESESLLLNILPAPIAHRLKSGERAIADKFDSVTVLFADIVGFTKLSAQTTPEELVQGLNAIFERFDALAKKYGLEKIKTIGDAYMVAGGLPERSGDHCERVAMFALEIQAAMREKSLRTNAGERVELRIGIHTGEAVAGVIGTSKFSYDLWGDTVNTASRMESHGEPGKIHCSEEVYKALKEKFVFEERGDIDIKGKGVMRTWFLKGINYIALHTSQQGV